MPQTNSRPWREEEKTQKKKVVKQSQIQSRSRLYAAYFSQDLSSAKIPSTQMASSGAALPNQPNQKVQCFCVKRCGGPDGVGKPRAISTRNRHLREDAVASLSSEFRSSLASSSTAAVPLAGTLGRRASEIDSTDMGVNSFRHKRARMAPDAASPRAESVSLSLLNRCLWVSYHF